MSNTDRLIGYKAQPFCGKDCCRSCNTRIGRKAEKRALKRSERQEWKREVRAA